MRFPCIHYVRDLARQSTPLTEMDVRSLHRLVVLRSRPDQTLPVATPIKAVMC
jgi:hypothetical protein